MFMAIHSYGFAMCVSLRMPLPFRIAVSDVASVARHATCYQSTRSICGNDVLLAIMTHISRIALSTVLQSCHRKKRFVCIHAANSITLPPDVETWPRCRPMIRRHFAVSKSGVLCTRGVCVCVGVCL